MFFFYKGIVSSSGSEGGFGDTSGWSFFAAMTAARFFAPDVPSERETDQQTKSDRNFSIPQRSSDWLNNNGWTSGVIHGYSVTSSSG